MKQKKYRDAGMKYLIEGPNLIREALENGGEIEMILQSEDFREEAAGSESAGLTLFGAARDDIPMAAVTPTLFRRLSDTETPQGIMAVVKKQIWGQEEFFSSGQSGASNVIVLDRLQDPGNIGTILRTADAAGYLGAVIMKGTADIYSPKIVRAAAGSLFRLPVLAAETPGSVIGLLKQHGKSVICTAPAGDRFYYDVDLKENAAVIIGNEGNGACDEFLKHSDFLVRIPMEGKIESLNAAVSAGILMYESVRRKHRE